MSTLLITSMLLLVSPSKALDSVRFDQNLGAAVPMDVPFMDELGRRVTLADYHGNRPVVLALAYYRCPMLCTLVLSSMVKGLQQVQLTPGVDYQVVVISIDPRETPELAYAKKKSHVAAFGRKDTADGWHFLTGDKSSIDAVAQAIGYGYAFDEATDQYAHPAGLTILTADGRVSRYAMGVTYQPRDLRLALVDASNRAIGSPVDHLLLRCFSYDPATGRYTLAVHSVLRAGAALTIVAIGVLLMTLIRRDRRRICTKSGTASEA